MVVHIDYPPTKDCRHPELTYGELCVKCGDCGRFEKGGVSNPIRSDVNVYSQFNAGIPPFWEYPVKHAGELNGKWSLYRGKNGKRFEGTLQDMINEWWYPERKLPYVRWWIEGRNY